MRMLSKSLDQLKTTRYNQPFSAIFFYLISPFLIAACCIVLYGINKGYEVTDDAFYSLAIRHPEHSFRLMMSWHYLIHALFGWMNLSLVGYRILRFVLIVTTCYFFAASLWKWLRLYFDESVAKQFGFGSVFTVVLLGELVRYSASTPGLSYNVINQLLILINAGILLLTLSDQKPGNAWRPLALGFITSLIFFVKPPSGVLMACFVSAAFVFVFFNRIPVLFRLFLFFLSGIILASAFFFLTCNPATWFHNVFSGVSQLGGSSYLNRLSSEYVGIILAASRYLMRYFWISWVLFFIFSFSRRFLRDSKNVTVRILTLLCELVPAVYFCFQMQRFGFFRSSVYYQDSVILPYAVILIAALGSYLGILCARMCLWRLRRPEPTDIPMARVSKSFLPAAVLFVALPFVGAVGTDLIITITMMHHVTAWFCLLLLILFLICQEIKTRVTAGFFMAATALCVTAQLVFQLFYPYRLPAPIFQQIVQAPGGRYLHGLKVDAMTALMMKDLRAIVANQTNFTPGDPVLALYQLPGLVLLLDGISPARPGYFEKNICQSLSAAKGVDWKKAVLLVNTVIGPAEADCLRSVGVDFPQSYEKAGTVFFPYAPFLEADKKTIDVYKLKL